MEGAPRDMSYLPLAGNRRKANIARGAELDDMVLVRADLQWAEHVRYGV